MVARFKPGDPSTAPKKWKASPSKKGGKETAVISCPQCGKAFRLTGHTITPLAKVEGEVKCPAGCGWSSDHVVLKRWTQRRKDRA